MQELPPLRVKGIEKNIHQRETGPSNETLVVVNGHNCFSLIDSGSSITTITETYVRNHPKLNSQPRQESSIQFVNSSGNTMKYNGKIELDLHILGEAYRGVQAFVVPETEYSKHVPLLIGTAVIRALQISLEKRHGNGYMGQIFNESPVWHAAMIKYNETVVGGLSGYIGVARYNGRRPRIIPPYGKEVDVPLRIPRITHQSFIGLLEKSNERNGPQSLLIANTLVRVADQHVKVRVCNPTDQPLVIQRHARLADLFVVDDVETGLNSLKDDGKETCSRKPNDHLRKVNINKDFSNEQLELVEDLLNRNSDVFSTSSNDHGHTETLKHNIPLIDETPFKVPRRRTRPADYNELIDTL